MSALLFEDQKPGQVHHNPDGSIEFTCDGCESRVFCAVDDGFGFPVCMECRFYGERPHVARPLR